jgi:chromosome partitioning protein
MNVIAVYNIKGGVGKTTTAVNLSYVAAAGGQRVLLWDLDLQAASTFVLRVRPRVAGFGKKSLESGEAFAAAIKETDYDNLDLLPADFAYRKFDRLLGELGKPAHVLAALLTTLGRDYDAVILDCPPGFSLIARGIFAAADVVLVPTIPTVLSLRTVARIIKWADGADSPSHMAAFFSMVDRRKALHRCASDWVVNHPEVFLNSEIPYASVVEQMTVRRTPLGVFAPRDPATSAFAQLWAELQTRVRQQRREGRPPSLHRRTINLKAIESLIVQLESVGSHDVVASRPAPATAAGDVLAARGAGGIERAQPLAAGDVHFIHHFDTEDRDLQRRGYVLQFHESPGSLSVVAARSGSRSGLDATQRTQADIDRCWAVEILSGAMSPLEAFERRLGTFTPQLVERIIAAVGGRKLRRVDSRVAGSGIAENTTRAEAAGRLVSCAHPSSSASAVVPRQDSSPFASSASETRRA